MFNLEFFNTLYVIITSTRKIKHFFRKGINMKKLLLLSVAAVVAFGATESYAQTATTGKPNASAQVAAKIIEGLSISKVKDMNFGAYIADASSQLKAILGTNNQISGSAKNKMVKLDQNTPAAAEFKITGTPNATFSVVATSEGLNGTGNKMTLSDFKYNFEEKGEGNGEGLILKGNGQLLLGATLNIAAKQAVGDYSGSVTVTVNY